MEELIDDIDKKELREPKGYNYIASFFILIILVAIVFSYGVFSSPPSLGYLSLLFVAAFIFLFGIVIVVLLNGHNRILSAIITLISAVAILFSAINTGDKYVVMNTGKIIASICFLANVFLLVKVLTSKSKTKN